jgi:hypothetical protein
MCWAIPNQRAKQGDLVSNEASTKVNKQLGDTTPLQTLAKGDKLTVTVERIDGGKLRCTGATWSDAVVIFPGEILAFQNIERQAHVLRAPSPGGVKKAPPAEPGPIASAEHRLDDDAAKGRPFSFRKPRVASPVSIRWP